MNALRLALGTLTVLPVRAPVVDRRVAGWAMVLAPLVGLVLALPVVVLLEVLAALDASPLLAAAGVVGLLALLTRGLHLDGLADTADGLGSGRPAGGALEVMRRGDVGPFGVVALVLVLLVQVAAVAQLVAAGSSAGLGAGPSAGLGAGPGAMGVGAAGVAAALVVSRTCLPLACLSGVPAARGEGLGAAVAGTVTRRMVVVAVALSAATLLAAVLAGSLTGSLTGSAAGLTVGPLVGPVLAAPLGLLAGLAVVWRAVRRLGGVTGDVLGAAVEVTFTASLVVLALA